MKGYTASIEPRILTNVGIKILDLCVWKGGKYIILDVAVVADTVDRVKLFHESKKGQIRHARNPRMDGEECSGKNQQT